jgi:segregation and condensation protein B
LATFSLNASTFLPVHKNDDFCYSLPFPVMPEQETEPQEETQEAEQTLGETAHPFDSKLDVPQDRPIDDEDETADAKVEPAAEDAVSDISEAEPEEGKVLAVEKDEDPAEGEKPEEAATRRAEDENETAPDAPARSAAEVMSISEAIIFVSDEPISSKTLGEIIGEDKETIQAAVEELQKEYEERGGGLQIREIAGGWQIATRTEYHEEIRKFLKTRPSAKLSLAALETLAVIAYKQPVTVPEILEIRGVQSASAIKTLLEKRLIVTKGHKETVGRPMMYGTSKDFLIQFGLKDLSDLPSIEDFEDLVQSS